MIFSIIAVILLIIIILLIILLILFSRQLKTINFKGHDTFEFKPNSLCTAVMIPKISSEQDKFCSSELFNGDIFGLIDWTSNTNKNLFSYYYVLGTSYIENDTIYTTQSYWLTIFDSKTKNTAGTLRWSFMWDQSIKNKSTTFNNSLPFLKSDVSAASGNLLKYNNANILMDCRDKNKHIIHLYTNDFYKNKDFEDWKKNN